MSTSDINACIASSCGANAISPDQAAPSLTRTCTCLPGYTGDATTRCTGEISFQFAFSESMLAYALDINACTTNPCSTNALCTDIPAPSLNRTCNCNAGYTGNADAAGGCTGWIMVSPFHPYYNIHLFRLQCLHRVAVRHQFNLHRQCTTFDVTNLRLMAWFFRQCRQCMHRYLFTYTNLEHRLIELLSSPWRT